jgi:hypothetical protein
MVLIEGLRALPKHGYTNPRDHGQTAACLPYVIAIACHRINPRWSRRGDQPTECRAVVATDAIRQIVREVSEA